MGVEGKRRRVRKDSGRGQEAKKGRGRLKGQERGQQSGCHMNKIAIVI